MRVFRLAELFHGLDDVSLTDAQRVVEVTDVCDDSAAVRPGALFVAVPGTERDGTDYVPDAVARGAAAVVSERDVVVDVPVIRVPDARSALAQLAAAFHDFPARALRMVGITGTIGKTSVLSMLGAILDVSGVRAGSIGSLGVAIGDEVIDTGNTTPGIVTLQHALAAMRRRGAEVAAMEVTSHALLQQRVRGVRFDLGIFTNLRMLEHMEYHDSFDDYASAKLRFLAHLLPDAPLIYAAGDRAVKQTVRGHPGPRISCGGGPAWVGIRRDAMRLTGTGLTLRIRRPLPRLDGTCFDPADVPMKLRMVGRANTVNAALAAVAGLCLGATADAVRTALSRLEPPRRRMEVLRHRDPVIIDDTVGHPDSISAVYELVERIPHARVRTIFCIRGCRGEEINRHDAEALVVWHRRMGGDLLHVTSAEDTADERNSVSAAEREACLSVLRREGVHFVHHDRLEDAVTCVLADSAARDVVLLLGAQGMDAGADFVRRYYAERDLSAVGPPRS
jgi:UDP-N-acetylmuramoyl-L-alanyl-D-glutamate--2,6-diaminopimelate ligase